MLIPTIDENARRYAVRELMRRAGLAQHDLSEAAIQVLGDKTIVLLNGSNGPRVCFPHFGRSQTLASVVCYAWPAHVVRIAAIPDFPISFVGDPADAGKPLLERTAPSTLNIALRPTSGNPTHPGPLRGDAGRTAGWSRAISRSEKHCRAIRLPGTTRDR